MISHTINKTTSKWLSAIALCVLGVTVLSCNKSFDNKLTPQPGFDSSLHGTMQRKVLLVVVNGARGLVVDKANTPFLDNMVDNAIYSYNALSGYNNVGNTFTGANGWANILTGVTEQQHQVTTDDFAGNNLTAYPTFLSILKTKKPAARTAAFVSSANIKANLLSNATVAPDLASDAAVQTAALAEIKDNDASVVLVEYNGVEIAGQANGFNSTTPAYLAAIGQVDTYVGALLDQLKKRTTYATENWLIIVTSSKGGETTEPVVDISAYGDARRNTFTIFYQTKFASLFVPKPFSSRGFSPYIASAIRLHGNPTDAAVGGARAQIQNKTGESNQSVFDVENGALTIEAKIKINPKTPGVYSYGFPPLFSKTTARTGSTAGWSIFKNGNGFTGYLANGTANIQIGGSSAGAITDNLWHTIAMVAYRDGASFNLEMYKDGDIIASGSLASATPITSTAPVTLGFNPEVFSSEFIDMQMMDVRIWKTRVAANIINLYDCFDRVPGTHPNYANLVGEWSLRDGAGDTSPDLTGNGRPAKIQGLTKTGTTVNPIQWVPFNEVSDNLCPSGHETFYKIVPNGVDIPVQILQWIGIQTTGYNFQGRSWIGNYINL